MRAVEYNFSDFFKGLEEASGLFLQKLDAYLSPMVEGYTNRMRQETRYPAIADDFYAHTTRVPGALQYEVGNDNPYSGMLIGGTKAHTIVQKGHAIPLNKARGFQLAQGGVNPHAIIGSMARKDIVIQHPGVAPDRAVISLAAQLEMQADEAIKNVFERYYEGVK